VVYVFVQNESGYELDCDMLPLFELGSVQRAQYLLNIRLPNSSHAGSDEMKNDLRKLKEISVYVSSSDNIQTERHRLTDRQTVVSVLR